MARAAKRHPVLTAAARLLAAIAVVGCLLRLLPSSFQGLPYVANVIACSPWFAALAAIAAVLALATRRWMTLFLSVLCICAQAYWQMPFFVAGDALGQDARNAVAQVKPDTSDAYARVMTCNVFMGQASAQDIVDAVRSQHVEVLALQEISAPFVEELEEAGIESYLPYSITAGIDDDGYGNGLWSAAPMSRPVDAEISSSASSMPAGTIGFGGREVRFMSVHTTSPRAGQWAQWRRSLEELQQVTERTGIDYVMMGDFNATVDHAPLRDVMGSRFKDAAEASGHGLEYTWPADWRFVPAFAGIDHVLVEQGVTVGQVETASVGGSDHKALLATLDFSRL